MGEHDGEGVDPRRGSTTVSGRPVCSPRSRGEMGLYIYVASIFFPVSRLHRHLFAISGSRWRCPRWVSAIEQRHWKEGGKPNLPKESRCELRKKNLFSQLNPYEVRIVYYMLLVARSCLNTTIERNHLTFFSSSTTASPGDDSPWAHDFLDTFSSQVKITSERLNCRNAATTTHCIVHAPFRA